jgi:ATP/maltotriose-dependent transcriptional regulator MalT
VAHEVFGPGGSGGASRALDEAARARTVLEPVGDDAGLARAWRLTMNTENMLGNFERASVAAERLVHHATLAGDRRLASRSSSAISYILVHGPTPVDDAVERCLALLPELAGDRRVESVVLSALAQLHAMQGDFDEARRLYRQGQDMLNELGTGIDASSTSIDSSRVEILAGDLDAAERELRRDHEALEALGERYFRSTVAALLAEVLWAQGKEEAAARFASTAEEIADADDVLSQVPLRMVHAKAAARSGEGPAAELMARAAVAIADETSDIELRADAMVHLSQVFEILGRSEDASAPLEVALDLYEKKGDRVSANRTRSNPLPAVRVS